MFEDSCTKKKINIFNSVLKLRRSPAVKQRMNAGGTNGTANVLQSWAQEGVAEDQLCCNPGATSMECLAGRSPQGSKRAHPIPNLPETSSCPTWPSAPGKPQCRAFPPFLRAGFPKKITSQMFGTPRMDKFTMQNVDSVRAQWQLSFNNFLFWSQLPVPDVLSHGDKAEEFVLPAPNTADPRGLLSRKEVRRKCGHSARKMGIVLTPGLQLPGSDAAGTSWGTKVTTRGWEICKSCLVILH